MEAQAMIDHPQLAGFSFNQDVAALAVGVVGEKIEEHHRPQALLVLLAEGEVVIIRIEIDVLLQ
jgi:hypothetical protein